MRYINLRLTYLLTPHSRLGNLSWKFEYKGCKIKALMKELIGIKKINFIKNLNKNTTIRQQSSIL